MDVFGSFALVLAFICAVYAFGGGIAAIVTRHPLLIKSTRQAGMATCCLIFLATFSLEYLFFSDNFSIAYVVAHSNRDLAPFYKIAALWAGQEGSLLFWSFLLAIYVFSVLVTYRNKNGELMPYVGVVMAGVQIFFLTLNNFVASPFKLLASPGADGVMHYVARTDGNGLTPLLQYPEMVIHPPNLYSGYTGFTIPFAFALGALLARYPGEKWIHLTRKWTMIAWMFQSMGILLGAHWAYAVLGWGGYWGWDPVENASFLPWLTGTAFPGSDTSGGHPSTPSASSSQMLAPTPYLQLSMPTGNSTESVQGQHTPAVSSSSGSALDAPVPMSSESRTQKSEANPKR